MGASRVGAELRARRTGLGWTLPDVAQTLRIRLPYLEAIEDGRLNDMPGNAYAVGFIRTYAASLGLDPAEIARRFRAEAQDVNRQTELAFPAPVPERGVPAGAVLLLGTVLAVGTYVAWYHFSGDARGPVETTPMVPERLAPLAERSAPINTSPQVASILPQVQPPAPAAALSVPPVALMSPPYQGGAPLALPAPMQVPIAPLPAGPTAAGSETSRVMLHFKADSYVQVKEKDGRVLINRVMRAGETWAMPRGTPLQLTTGNAGGTEVLVDGVASPALGPDGGVRRDIPVDVDGLKQGVALVTVKPAPAVAAAPVHRAAVRPPASATPSPIPSVGGEPPKVPF